MRFLSYRRISCAAITLLALPDGLFVGLFHSILCLLILYVLFSRLGYNEKYTHRPYTLDEIEIMNGHDST